MSKIYNKFVGENEDIFSQTKRDDIKLVFISMIVGLLLGLILTTNVFCFGKVVGQSMEPTYHDGDRLFISKVVEPDNGDIIVFDLAELSPKSIGKDILVKRVIGKPGDMVRIENSSVYINGVKIKEGYIKDKYFDAGESDVLEITLGNDEYFVLGDNRNNSYDSRYFGAINESCVEGVCLWRFF